MYTVNCEKCGKEYQKNDQVARDCEHICYECALSNLCGDGYPEEGDFNTARLQSGEISDQAFKQLRRELTAIEQGQQQCYMDTDDSESSLDYEETYCYQHDDEDLDSEWC
jgi:hypothetical protein